VLCSVGWVNNSKAHLEEALLLFHELHYLPGICETHIRLATVVHDEGDFVRARSLLDEGIRLTRSMGERSILAWLFLISAYKNWHGGILDERTTHLCDESLSLFRVLRNRNGVAAVLHLLGRVAHDSGDAVHARKLFARCLRLGHQILSKGYPAICLIYLAEYDCSHNEVLHGTRILGALREPIRHFLPGCGLFHSDIRQDYERILSAARDQLDEATFAAAFAEGQRMTFDQAITAALARSLQEDNDPFYPEPSAHHRQSFVDPLTPRELEILHHMSVGLTNQEIADQLFIGVSTVKKHITHIYSKLGVNDRVNAINQARTLELLPSFIPYAQRFTL
jgi:DNA-binding CsgD family transcriptional regulator